MKVVLCGVGSTGDIQPLMALSRALATRGHDVVLCAGENYQQLAPLCGATFKSNGRSVEKMVKDAGDAVFNPLTFMRICREIAPEQLDLTIEACRGADLVVGGAACFVGPSAAKIAGARYVWAALAPGCFPTSTAPFLLSGIGSERPWLNRLTHTIGVGLVSRLVISIVNPLNAQRGLPPIQSYNEHVFAHESLYAVDPLFSAMPSDWAIKAHQTGFWFFDDGAPFPDDLTRFLDDGEPPVYVGFGSMPVRDRAARTRAIVDGIAKTGRRALISTGWAGLGDGDLPSSCFRVGHVSHARLFPRCALAVHHCGAGTTSAATRAGVPQLPVPHAYDQPTWTGRLLALGVARTSLHRNFSATALAAAINETLGDDDVRDQAASLGAHLQATNGATDAAAILETMAV